MTDVDIADINKAARRWRWTYNNPGEISHLTCANLGCEYLCYGKELAPSTGTPHLQGYTVWKNPRRRKDLMKKLKVSWCGTADMSFKSNKDYCSKGGEFHEEGVPPKEVADVQAANAAVGKAYWADLKSKAIANKLDEIDPKSYCQLYSTLKCIAKDHMVRPSDGTDMTGIWYVGPAGSGKSRNARLTFPDFYDKLPNKWWCGYNGQDTAIIDDVGIFHVALGDYLKRWGDRYAFTAETKGSAISIRPKNVVVTSQYRIEDIWSDVETREALNRRFKVINFPVEGKAVQCDVLRSSLDDVIEERVAKRPKFEHCCSQECGGLDGCPYAGI